MASTRSNVSVSLRGDTFTSNVTAIAAPGSGLAIQITALELQVVGGGATLYLDDGTNELGCVKLAADGVWSSQIERLLAANAALTIRGGSGGLTLNGYIRYSIVAVGS